MLVSGAALKEQPGSSSRGRVAVSRSASKTCEMAKGDEGCLKRVERDENKARAIVHMKNIPIFLKSMILVTICLDLLVALDTSMFVGFS